RRVVLGGELKRPAEVRGPEGSLQGSHDAISEFERDIRALVETEQAAHLIAEAVLADVLVETVAQVKVPAAGRKPQRGRQIDQDEVWFGGIEDPVIRGPLPGGRRRVPP